MNDDAFGWFFSLPWYLFGERCASWALKGGRFMGRSSRGCHGLKEASRGT